ncbi:MAG: hypothetical protein GX098_10670 [Bacteroidales bacterium]|nr:hypothetical protein [Bacteroidales bacterium]
MFRFIKSISLVVQILVPVIALIFFLPVPFLSLEPPYAIPQDGIHHDIGQVISRLPHWAPVLASLLVTLAAALMLNTSDRKHVLTGRRSYAIAFVFIFLIASSGQAFFFHPAFLAGLLILNGNRYLLEQYKTESSYPLVFSQAFNWSLAGVIYPPVFFILPAVVIGMVLMGSATLRHFLVLLAGLITPIILVLAIWFLTGQLDYEMASIQEWFALRIDFIPNFLRSNWLILGWLLLILVCIIIASVGYRNPRVQSRRLFQVNFIQFILTLGIPFFVPLVGPEIIRILLVPGTYFLTFWLLEVDREWKRNLFFIMMLASWLTFLLSHTIYTL